MHQYAPSTTGIVEPKGYFAEASACAWAADAGPSENIRRTVTKVERCHAIGVPAARNSLSWSASRTMAFLFLEDIL